MAMRRTIYAIAIIAILSLLLSGCGGGESTQPESQEESQNLKCVFDDPTFSFELLRLMGEAVYDYSRDGGSDDCRPQWKKIHSSFHQRKYGWT